MHDDHSSEVDARLLTHLVEAAGMKSDIENLRSNQSELTNRVLVSLGEMAGDIKAIRADMTAVPERIAACRLDMRREVDKDFPNRVDAIEMEKRIETQIRDTDRKLSDQITAVDAGSKARHADMNVRIDGVKSELDKQWIKISTAVGVVILVFGLLAWGLQNISGSVLKGNERGAVSEGVWQNYQQHNTNTSDTPNNPRRPSDTRSY
jgi:hypothetical protein